MAAELADTQKYEFLRPVQKAWLSVVEEAIRVRKDFDSVSDQCTAFFSEASGFMWKPEFMNKYLGQGLAPRFRITLQKAFELVARYGPYLYWRNPHRTVRPRRYLDLAPEMFLPPGYQPQPPPDQPPGMMNGQEMEPPPDPIMQQAMALYQEAQRVGLMEAAANHIQSQLFQTWLNYTPDEMPYGGLSQHSSMAITQGLVVGRGVAWPDWYKMPGSKRVLTGCFWDDQKNLYYDPDCTDASDAYFIVRKGVKPWWKWERQFELPKTSLRKYTQYESGTARGMGNSDEFHRHHRNQGKTQDLIVVYEIWSKMGPGGRLYGVKSPIRDALDKVVGDYAYIAVSPSIPFPLNAPSAKVREADDESVERMFRWPIPFWKDDRWPCAVLEFYRRPGSPYPIAPLAPGLGELAYLNVFMSHLANRIWSSSRDFVVCLESAAKHIEPLFRGGEDMVFARIPQMLKDIQQSVTFLKQPEVNKEVWEMIDRVSQNFEKRVGLEELFQDTQSRSATDIEAKREQISIRPDYMAGKVESWQSDMAQMEMFVTRMKVESSDVKERVGAVGAWFWEKFITDEDPEIILRGLKASVEAGSARKRNKQLDAQNMNAALPILFPELSKHADVTGDTNPVNALARKWAESIDLEVDDMLMGPRVPQQPEMPPEQQQMMQQEAQLEMAKLQADVQKSQADLQKTTVEMQKVQLELQGFRQEVQRKQIESHLDMQVKQLEAHTRQQESQADLQKMMIEAQLDIQTKQTEAQLEERKAQQEMQLEQTKAQQGLMFDAASHQQDMQQTGEEHAAEMRRAAYEHMAQMDAEKEKAKVQSQAMKEKTSMQTKMMREKMKIQAQQPKQKPKGKSNGGK